MPLVRFIGVPRSMLNTIISEEPGFRHLGQRMLERAQAMCPVSQNDQDDGGGGPHLRDTLEVKFITGADPRILIGSVKKGDVLTYLTNGTSDHFVAPVNASALRWTDGGTVYFSAGHEVKGIEANSFVLDAARDVLHGG